MPRKRIKPKPVRQWDAAPGYFSEPVTRVTSKRPHGFPPHFTATEWGTPPPAPTYEQMDERARTGAGWGNGTLTMPGTPKHARPAWQHRGKSNA